MEREQHEAIADAIGISAEDLDRTQWRIEPHDSEDGVIYGHNVYFEEGSDPDVLARIKGLVNGEWVRIGPFPDHE